MHMLIKFTVYRSIVIFVELIPSPSCDVDDNDADEIHRMEVDVNGANRMMVPAAKEINVPALGKHWKTICSIRLQMQRSKATSMTTEEAAAAEAGMAITKKPNERIIRILKSNQHPANGCCVVHIKDTGIE